MEHKIDSSILAMVIISTPELRAARSCAQLAEYYPHENLRHEIQKLTEQLLKLCMYSPWDRLAPISSKKRGTRKSAHNGSSKTGDAVTGNKRSPSVPAPPPGFGTAPSQF